MFFQSFNLDDHPFAETPDNSRLLADQRFEQALARLQFFSQCAQLAVVLGHTGTGKSSLLRLYLSALPKNHFNPVYLHLTLVNPNALLRLIVNALGEKPKMGKDRLFLQLIDKIRNTDAHTLLIIDEAHLLADQALTDLRLMISSGIDAQLPIKIILCGQMPLAAQLKRSHHADLLNRVGVQVRLASLSKHQTCAYIDHRIKCVGGSAALFDNDAKQLIHDFAGGICRQINNIATACLIQANAINARQINTDIVHQAIAELHMA